MCMGPDEIVYTAAAVTQKDLLDFIPMKPAPKPQPPVREVKSFPAAAVRLRKLGEPFWPDNEA